MTGKKLLSLFAVLTLLVLASAPAARADTETWYVYTENGKSLNVRSAPLVADNTLVGHLAYGARVQVLYFDGNWACINYHFSSGAIVSDEAWVQKRFLVRNKPGSGSSSSSSSTSKPAATTGQLGVMNREFKTLQRVNPFEIIAKPVRSSGFVNLRWAPHAEAEICGIAYYGHRLMVLASTTNWYQVEDEETGYICFVMKQYTMVN